MTMTQAVDASQACEAILREGISYNVEHEILPSENAVANRLLSRASELAGAYQELHAKLDSHPPALKVFLDLLLSTAAFWNPESIAEARAGRARLAEVNRQIASKAEDLAELLDERSELHNQSAFWSNTQYHVCQVIETAAHDNHLFDYYVRDELRALRGRFDLKYWPTLGAFLSVLARDADDAEMEATDPLTVAATTAKRASLADFFKALFAAIEENSARHHGFLPTKFKITDETLASLVNCALGLGPDDLVDGAYVKRLRQRERQRRSTERAP